MLVACFESNPEPSKFNNPPVAAWISSKRIASSLVYGRYHSSLRQVTRRRDHCLPWTIFTAVCHTRVPVSNKGRRSTATSEDRRDGGTALKCMHSSTRLLVEARSKGYLRTIAS